MPWTGAQIELERSNGLWRIMFEVNSTEVTVVKNAFGCFAHEGCPEAGWSDVLSCWSLPWIRSFDASSRAALFAHSQILLQEAVKTTLLCHDDPSGVDLAGSPQLRSLTHTGKNYVHQEVDRYHISSPPGGLQFARMHHLMLLRAPRGGPVWKAAWERLAGAFGVGHMVVTPARPRALPVLDECHNRAFTSCSNTRARRQQ